MNKEQIILVDSRDRNTEAYTTNKFPVKISPLFNITSIELIQLIAPVSSDFTAVPYFFLKFAEFSLLETTISSTAETTASSAFAVIPVIDYDPLQYPSTIFWTNSASTYKLRFHPPLASLSQLSISLLRYNGSFYYTGAETWGVDWSMLLKIETL